MAITVTGALFLAANLLRFFRESPDFSKGETIPIGPVIVAYNVSDLSSGTIWQALQSRDDRNIGQPRIQSSPERYRLAGTFSMDGAENHQRYAILEDMTKHDQSIVKEGDHLDDAVVVQIFYDHVTLQSAAGSRDLWVEFAFKTLVAAVSMTTNNVTAQPGFTNKFGCVQVQENRWQFSRKPILEYYQELLDEPDRMMAVFDTMKPVRDDKYKISGYVVGIEGEKDFFDSMGLRQGDIVRSVNSFPMTNRRRAEAFIDQFLKNQLNAVVLDVERGGQIVKQVYQVQP